MSKELMCVLERMSVSKKTKEDCERDNYSNKWILTRKAQKVITEHSSRKVEKDNRRNGWKRERNKQRKTKWKRLTDKKMEKQREWMRKKKRE